MWVDKKSAMSTFVKWFDFEDGKMSRNLQIPFDLASSCECWTSRRRFFYSHNELSFGKIIAERSGFNCWHTDEASVCLLDTPAAAQQKWMTSCQPDHQGFPCWLFTPILALYSAVKITLFHGTHLICQKESKVLCLNLSVSCNSYILGAVQKIFLSDLNEGTITLLGRASSHTVISPPV